MMIRIGTFCQLKFVEDDRAGLLEAVHHRCVLGWAKIPVYRHSSCGRMAFKPAQVLHRERHTVQRPTIAAILDFRFRHLGLSQRIIRGDESVGIQRTV